MTQKASVPPPPPSQIRTGIEGLDGILNGGLPPYRLYLVQGDPGAGKTTLALQFLLEGAKNGEKGLYVTLSETEEELRAVADSHGWALDGLILHELSRTEERLASDEQNTFFRPSEVELNETTQPVLDVVEKHKPARVVFDSLSEMRLLAGDPLRYRRQILALKQFFIGRHCTVLLLDDRTSASGDLQLQSLAHGVISLEQLSPEYGMERRRLRVVKLRGLRFRGGYHDFTIQTGGLNVFPRLVASEHRADFKTEAVPSGIGELDALLGGGLDRGTSSLFMGPAGVGKSSLASQYAASAAIRGERSSVFIFDESERTFLARAASLHMDVQRHVDEGRITLRRVNPAELSPGEFAYMVRQCVVRDRSRIVVIDSLNGYLNAMSEERSMILQLHELLTFLSQQGVVTIMVVAQHGLLGSGMEAPVDVSYLADTVLLMRYFEHAGAIRQAISVMKKRQGGHERAVREITMGSDGIHVGQPLTAFEGVLTGTPQYHGEPRPLIEESKKIKEPKEGHGRTAD